MTDDEADDMIDRLLDTGNLTKWEASFVEGLYNERDDRTLTAREEEKLQEIYDNRV